jgi:tRNA A37 methylthiotransferase MiaB
MHVKVNMYQCLLTAGAIKKLKENMMKIYFLGQNVNSYRDLSVMDYYGGLPPDGETHLAKGFHTVYKKKKGGLRFSDLLDEVSRIDPEMRIRFTSPHPKDFPDEVNRN